MGRIRKYYTREFKLRALQLVETSGRPLVELERELGLSDGCLYQWQRELAPDDVETPPGNSNGNSHSRAAPVGEVTEAPEAGPAVLLAEVYSTARRRLEIAERVRLARQRKHMTQSDLARVLQCSRKRVNDVERGLSTLSALEIDVLAERLGFPHEFFYRRDA